MQIDFETPEKTATSRNLRGYAKTNIERRRKVYAPVYVDKTFRSNDMTWIIFVLLLLFNVLVFSSAFLIVCPQGLTKNNDFRHFESIIYGLATAFLIAKILFHQNWRKVKFWSPGPIVLYLNLFFSATYLDLFEVPLSQNVWAMKLLLVTTPVLGFIMMVLILQSESE